VQTVDDAMSSQMRSGKRWPTLLESAGSRFEHRDAGIAGHGSCPRWKASTRTNAGVLSIDLQTLWINDDRRRGTRHRGIRSRGIFHRGIRGSVRRRIHTGRTESSRNRTNRGDSRSRTRDSRNLRNPAVRQHIPPSSGSQPKARQRQPILFSLPDASASGENDERSGGHPFCCGLSDRRACIQDASQRPYLKPDY
jgi:hypothetical protein